MNLQDKFPKMFRYPYIDPVGLGWMPIVEQLCLEIQDYIDVSGAEQVEVIQIKEKYGGPRFYTYYEDDVISNLIADAENKCITVCEVCGAPGTTVVVRGWAKVLCEEHAK